MRILHCRSVSITLLCFTLPIWIAGPASTAWGQQTDAPAMIGAESIPVDGMVTAMLSPAAALQSRSVELMPTEIADAWCLEYIGLKASEIETAKIVVAVPGFGDPMFAAVLKLSRDFDTTTLHPDVIGDAEAIDIDGHSCLRVMVPADVVLHQVDARTIIVSSSNYLDIVISASQGKASGPLAKLAEATLHEGQVTVLFAVEPVRPMVTGLLQTVIDQIPPNFIGVAKIPQLVDAIIVRVNIEDSEKPLELEFLTRDDESAKELEKIVVHGLGMMREMAVQQAASQIRGNDPVASAMQRYSERLADEMVTSLTPQRSGRRLSIVTSSDIAFGTQAIMLSMLMPAVQQAQRVAERETPEHKLKQIALALHNHHAAYKKLPDIAIRDEQGKPLLSWRVKILPFLEHQALYKQFHLDEPWDSPHNIKLLDKMPDIYKHPGVQTNAGTTIYQVPIGKNTIFKEDGPTRFRDIIDGISNTIMVMETHADLAVEWTKPADAQIDMDDPLASVGDHPPGKFHVVLGDGSWRILDRDMAPARFRAVLTAGGGEPVGEF